MTTSNLEEITRTKINMETSRIAWRELQRFFANGTAIVVSAELDLVEVAYQIYADNRAQVKRWMEDGVVARVSDEQAQAWYEADSMVWAVVVSPFVLVQAEKKLH